MATTSVRDIELIVPGSFGKETLSNDGMQNLALGISGAVTIPLAGTDVTLTEGTTGQAQHFVQILTGTLTANVNVIVPAESRVYIADNRTTGAFTVTFKTASGGGIAVDQGVRTLIYCDGINVYPVAGASGGGGSGAPTDATYLVQSPHSLLTGERAVTDTATVTWDFATAGQARASIPPDAITYSHLQNVTPTRLLGRFTAGAGDVQEVTPGTGLTLDASGVLSVVAGGGAQPADATLTALAGLATGANQLPYFTGTDTAAQTPLTPFARTLLADADQVAMQTTLGIVPGSTVQPLDATLTALAGVTTGADRLAFFTGVDTATTTVLTPFMRSLLDDANQAQAQATLGVTPGGGATPGGTPGQVQYNSAGSFGGSSALTLDATTLLTLAPLTTKGDVLVQGATTPLRLPVGTDGQVLTADAAEVAGVKWSTPAAGGSSEWTRVDTSVATLTSGLLAFWRMEETSGNRVESVAGMALVPQGSATSAVGKHGNAAKTTGVSGTYFSIADNTTLSIGAAQSFTIACWAYFDSFPTGDHCLVGKGNVASAYSGAEFMLWNRTGTLRFSVGNGSTLTEVNSGFSTVLNQWIFIIAWLDAPNNVLWIQVNNTTPVSIACPHDSYDSTFSMEVGRQPNWSSSPILNGRVDNLMLYKRLLTTEERAALWNSGLGLDYPDLGSGTTFLHPVITTDKVLAGASTLTAAEPLESAGGVKLGTSTGTVDGVVRWSGSDFEGRKAGAWVSLITPSVSATDRLLGRVSAGAGLAEEVVCTPAGRALLDDADAAAQRATLGLGTMATQNASAVAITGGTVSPTTGVVSQDWSVNRDLYVTRYSQFANAVAIGTAPQADRVLNMWTNRTTQNGIVMQSTGDDAGPFALQVFLALGGAAVGSITATASATAYNTSSDARLKHAIAPLKGTLGSLRAVRPISHRWNADGSPGESFLAHELMREFPLAVSGQPDELNADGSIKPQQVDHSKMIPRMVAWMQELLTKIDTLEAQVAALQGA